MKNFISLFIFISLIMPSKSFAETESTQNKLDAMKNKFEASAPKEKIEIYNKGIEEVAASGVLETSKKQGDIAPDFSLPDATGEKVTLSKFLEKGPVIVTWYRGEWCPYCNIYLQSLNEIAAEAKEHDISIIAISPELPEFTISMKAKNKLGFHVLSDVGNKVAKEYGITYTLPAAVQQQFKGRLDVAGHNGDDSFVLPLAVSYVINKEGKIIYSFIDSDYKKRAEPRTLLDAAKEVE